MIEENDLRLQFIPLDVAQKPTRGFLNCIVDYWWCVHPEKGLIIFHHQPQRNGRWREEGSPQANSNESLSRDLGKRLYPWAEVQQVPFVFLKHDCKDYL